MLIGLLKKYPDRMCVAQKAPVHKQKNIDREVFEIVKVSLQGQRRIESMLQPCGTWTNVQGCI